MAKKKAKTKSASRSGYAVDIMPDIVESNEAQGLTVPRRVGSGFSARQVGRPLPKERKYVPGTHNVVTAEEAQANMIKRTRGELDPIKGGTDDPMMAFEKDLPDEPPSKLEIVAVDLPDEGEFDPLGDINLHPEPGDPELEAEEKALAKAAEESSRTVTKPSVQTQTVTNVPVRDDMQYVQVAPGPTLTEQFLLKRERIILGLADGSMQMTVMAVIPSTYGVTILLPLSDDSVTFIPKPGSEIRITKADESWDCYFPGITFELPALQMFGMVFVRNTEDVG